MTTIASDRRNDRLGRTQQPDVLMVSPAFCRRYDQHLTRSHGKKIKQKQNFEENKKEDTEALHGKTIAICKSQTIHYMVFIKSKTQSTTGTSSLDNFGDNFPSVLKKFSSMKRKLKMFLSQ